MSQEIGQYNCLKQTPSSKFVFLSHDKVSNIAYKMHMFVLSGDTTLGFMQYLEHLKFLEYLQGVKGITMQMTHDQFSMSSKN